MTKARDLWERITESPPKYRILGVLAVLIAALSLLGLRHFYPHVDLQSARAVLGILIPTVATFFGFMLVALVLIFELSGRARKDLRTLMPDYLDILRGPDQPKTLTGTPIEILRRQYLSLLQREVFRLEENAEAAGGILESKYSHSELFGMISALAYVVLGYFDYEYTDRIEEDMKSIGYDDDQIIHWINVEGYLSLLDPHLFFETLGKALDVIHLPSWEDQPDLHLLVFERSMRDDIDGLLDRVKLFERASGNLFWIVSSALLIVIVMGTLLSLGLTPSTINLASVRGWLLATLFGAMISVYLVIVYLAQLL